MADGALGLVVWGLGDVAAQFGMVDTPPFRKDVGFVPIVTGVVVDLVFALGANMSTHVLEIRLLPTLAYTASGACSLAEANWPHWFADGNNVTCQR